ncbi:MAG TPA: hypothetical protein VFB50_15855 [Chloroflexota bacterium]|nr:hypothetical protein [Chloroflexota bacterium]
MTADLSRVDEWMYAVLSADLTIATGTKGRIYADEAPQGTPTPMVIFAFLGGADRLLTLRARLTSALYLVRAIGSGSSFNGIEPIADQIDYLLSTVVPDRGTIVRDTRITSCYREQPHQRKDSTQGVPIVYLGGYYRVAFQPAVQ